ncbi:hypothetical protein HX884_03945 [Enterobacter sp. SECR19-1250]|uniref:hypothetical protein n=1 Tax=Enterobacter sp. SECR19-1250 TaxID=2749084 RepID=UPI0015B5B6A8|nr:hypothetical protein [Enterobacter sp. SECR19-1250]NWJ78795.1 hypothetical protein [Enterobacter sp. SECR19-1250]
MTPNLPEQADEALTVHQLTDVFCYILRCAEYQAQPDTFTPPEAANAMVMQSLHETVIVWMQNGWPLAAAIPECGYQVVLTGIPFSPVIY